MKAIISTTYDDKYLYFLPIVTWCWNKLNVDVICFMPNHNRGNTFMHVSKTLVEVSKGHENIIYGFDAPEHKEATYAQCSRLYAACLDLPEDEILITSDVDMANFIVPPYVGGFTIFGSDLVPNEQYPICYVSAKVKDWRKVFELEGRTYQECLDSLLGDIECDHFRGNYWGKDQETAYNKISASGMAIPALRARPGTQFASDRVDRDDSYWRERVSDRLVDGHLWRPGYEPTNLANILELLKMMYRNESFKWITDYTNEYIKLL